MPFVQRGLYYTPNPEPFVFVLPFLPFPPFRYCATGRRSMGPDPTHVEEAVILTVGPGGQHHRRRDHRAGAVEAFDSDPSHGAA